MRIFITLLTFLFFFTACETDFDVNAEWQETTVVYGLLDASKSVQYIKINKAFLGEGDAMVMAQYSDSVNFNPNDLEVKLHKLAYIDTLMSLVLDTTLIDKVDGLFSIDNNIIYKVNVPNNFLNSDNRYVLTIKNLRTGNLVSSNTEVITNFKFENFNSAYKFGFYNPFQPDTADKFLSKFMQWNQTDNGSIYQLDVRFNYLENGDSNSLVWTQPLEIFEGSSMNSRLEGRKFFNFLRQNLASDNTITRQFLNLDLVMTVGTNNLNTYIQVNAPITGIVQQRPQFTTVSNGVGIFSSRFTHTEYNIGLTQDTRNYLVDELDRSFQ